MLNVQVFDVNLVVTLFTFYSSLDYCKYRITIVIMMMIKQIGKHGSCEDTALRSCILDNQLNLDRTTSFWRWKKTHGLSVPKKHSAKKTKHIDVKLFTILIIITQINCIFDI